MQFEFVGIVDQGGVVICVYGVEVEFDGMFQQSGEFDFFVVVYVWVWGVFCLVFCDEIVDYVVVELF